MILKVRIWESQSMDLIVGSGSADDRLLIRFIAGKLTLNSDSRKRPFVTVPNRPLRDIDHDGNSLTGFRRFAVIGFVDIGNG
jgi:hypothetical protein